MTELTPFRSKAAIARNFSRAAPTYDRAAVLQQEVGSRLIERLDFICPEPEQILDLGGGTGYFTELLVKKYPQSRVINFDLAYGMLTHAKNVASDPSKVSYLCGDGEQLPFASSSLDFIFSNCTLQWIQNPNIIFSEIKRVLKPNGLLLFSTFGPDTLRELKLSFLNIDELPHANNFMDMHNIADALLNLGFCNVIADMEKITLTYPDFKALIQDLKSTGANYVFREEPLGLSAKTTLKRLQENYEEFRDKSNNLPCTFEIIFGHALKNEVSFYERERNSSPTENLIQIPLSNIKYI